LENKARSKESEWKLERKGARKVERRRDKESKGRKEREKGKE